MNRNFRGLRDSPKLQMKHLFHLVQIFVPYYISRFVRPVPGALKTVHGFCLSNLEKRSILCLPLNENITTCGHTSFASSLVLQRKCLALLSQVSYLELKSD